MSFRVFRLAENGNAKRRPKVDLRKKARLLSARTGTCLSEGAQEFEECFLVRGFQLSEFFGDVSGFATMAENGVEKGDGSAIVHQARVQADTPKRSRADFIGGVVEFGDGKISPGGLVHPLAVVLQHSHDDAVASANIVEQEVTVGMKLFLAERGRDGESATVDFRSLGSSRKCLYVANITANSIK